MSGAAGAPGGSRPAAAGRGAGGARGQGAGDGAQHGGCLPALAAICAYEPGDCAIVEVPGPAGARPVVGGSAGGEFAALVTAGGEVHFQDHRGGRDGRWPGDASVGTQPPWPAAAVSCGHLSSVALRRGGRALWGCGVLLFHGEPKGLPRGDELALVGVGSDYVIAVTRSDEAYLWREELELCVPFDVGQRQNAFSRPPVRIAALSGRGLSRLACGELAAVAETQSGALIHWGPRENGGEPLTVLPRAGRVAYPLRSLAATRSAVAAADARGRLWCLWEGLVLTRAGLPAGERVVRAAGCGVPALRFVPPCFVALTVQGRLWDVRQGEPCRSITAAHPRLPLGLLPCGGSCAGRVILINDPSCGLRRCKLLLLVAGRRELLPADQMMVCIALRPFLVDDIFVFGSGLGSEPDGESAEGGGGWCVDEDAGGYGGEDWVDGEESAEEDEEDSAEEDGEEDSEEARPERDEE